MAKRPTRDETMNSNETPNAMSGARPSIVERGLFDPKSLFVRFDFTRDALLAATERYLETRGTGKPSAISEELQTYVHELTHYLQYITTPYGLFLQYCRLLQSNATIAMVRTLLDAGDGLQMPLLENVSALQ